MTNGRAGIERARYWGAAHNQRDDLNGTRSADFIRASGLCAAQTGRTHDRTRPTRQNITKALANRRPSTHALLNCPRFWVESPQDLQNLGLGSARMRTLFRGSPDLCALNGDPETELPSRHFAANVRYA
jgi:hypothetical protein